MVQRNNPDRASVISFHGALYAFFALLFLITGLARGELVSSICGGLLLCHMLFCLTLAFAAYITSRQTSVSLSWIDAQTVSARALSHARFLSGRMPRPFADATLVALYRVEPETPFASSFVLSVPLNAGETTVSVALPPRGVYSLTRASLVLSDFSGFFRFSRSLPDSACAPGFIVRPRPVPPFEERADPSVAGDASGKSVFRKSEDLFEARPYFPGDDPRKINWGLYAHTGSLFLREGELLPPPADEYVFSFVTRYPDRYPAQSRARKTIKRDFDALVDRAASLAIALMRQRKTVTIPVLTTGGESERVRIVSDNVDAEDRILSALARLQPGHPQVPDTDAQRAFAGRLTMLLFMTGDADTTFLSTLKPSGYLTIHIGPWDSGIDANEGLLRTYKLLSDGGYNVAKA